MVHPGPLSFRTIAVLRLILHQTKNFNNATAIRFFYIDLPYRCLVHFFTLNFLEISLSQALFFEVYISVFLITLLLIFVLLRAFRRMSNYVAWLYLVGSVVKFGLFMLLLWPVFKADGELSPLEKTTFLTPYCCSLILETRILIIRLNKI